MNCSKCHIPLDNNNWLPSRQKRNQFICKICIRQDNNRRYLIKKNSYLLQYKNKRRQIKHDVLKYYGGFCALCQEDDFNKLSLDHMDGYGRQHRKSVLKIDSGTNFYRWVLKYKPNNLRLLCYNCNCQVIMTKINLVNQYSSGCRYCSQNNCHCAQIKKRNRYIDLKLTVFSHYGNQCASCQESKVEFLTIDHLNNEGNNHRKEIGSQIFPWLKKHHYPNNFQILCFNCNYNKHFSNV